MNKPNKPTKDDILQHLFMMTINSRYKRMLDKLVDKLDNNLFNNYFDKDNDGPQYTKFIEVKYMMSTEDQIRLLKDIITNITQCKSHESIPLLQNIVNDLENEHRKETQFRTIRYALNQLPQLPIAAIEGLIGALERNDVARNHMYNAFKELGF